MSRSPEFETDAEYIRHLERRLTEIQERCTELLLDKRRLALELEKKEKKNGNQ